MAAREMSERRRSELASLASAVFICMPVRRFDDSVFALIDRIVAELRAEDGEVGHFLADIDVRMEKMLAELADVGARYKQLTAAQVATEEAMVGLKGQIAAIEDIDLAEALVELQSQEVAYQAALGATVKIPTPGGGSVSLKVPAGSQDGRTLRVRGKGAARLRGAGRGDLLACLRVVVPPRLTKEQRELVERFGKTQPDPRTPLFAH